MSSLDPDMTPPAVWCELRDVDWRFQPPVPVRSSDQGLTHQARSRVTRFIELHLAERITLAELASAACMSRFHFARKFRLTFGRSPMEYVLAAKVDLAKQLLVTRCHSIAYVAATLGFCDQSHFTRSFRRVAGCSPRQFLADGRRVAHVSPIPATASQVRMNKAGHRVPHDHHVSGRPTDEWSTTSPASIAQLMESPLPAS